MVHGFTFRIVGVILCVSPRRLLIFLMWLVELLNSALSSLSMAGYENSLMKMSGNVGYYQWTCGDVAEVKRRMRIVHSWIAQS